MRSSDYIQLKFQAWARRQGIELQGSAGERGEPNYTRSVEQNVFAGVLDSGTKASFAAGRGGELRGSVPKLCALHSSASLGVNLFQYWIVRQDWAGLARLLEVPSVDIESVTFERRYPVCDDWTTRGFSEPPHLDLGIDYADGYRVGVECKLFEPFGRLDHAPLKNPYLQLPDAWADIPSWRVLAEELTENSTTFHRLGAAQLLRHVLGLKFGTAAHKVRLVYLYYDALGDEAEEHRHEVARFQERVASDPIRFVPLSAQEFIIRAIRQIGGEHRGYVDYLTGRYL
jgi:hypothetical protein